MNDSFKLRRWLAALVFSGTAAAAEIPAPWTTSEKEGRIGAKSGDRLIFAWQLEALPKPVGGEKFASSAFLHPLRTPSGFEWTKSGNGETLTAG